MNESSELQLLFEKAVSESEQLSSRPDNDTLLQLYSLYKQATTGDINIDFPSNHFDVVGKAKYMAWEGLKGKTKENAMQEYIDLIERLKG